MLAHHEVTPAASWGSSAGARMPRACSTRSSRSRLTCPGLAHGQPAEEINDPLRVQQWLDGLPPSLTQSVLQMVRFWFGGVLIG